MLKTVSSFVNVIGALNYKGTWNASTNTPTLASGVGTKGDYYVVSVAGTTALDGISNWGVGDWVTFNGIVWQRVEGGADLNGVNLSVSGTSTLSGLTASTALALNASKEIVSVANTGTGNNVLATTPTLVGDVTLSTGNLVIGTSGKGIDFSATPGTGTSELLSDYEEGTWTPVLTFQTPGDLSVAYAAQVGSYTKIGNRVVLQAFIALSSFTYTTTSGYLRINGIPFNGSSGSGRHNYGSLLFSGITKAGYTSFVTSIESGLPSAVLIYCSGSAILESFVVAADMPSGGTVNVKFTMTYEV